MAAVGRPNWFSRAENIWLLVACGLGIINLFLILLLWNVSGAANKTDSLSVSLTVLEILLAVVALGGFFLIRGAAVRAAEEEARNEAERLAPPVARRAAKEYLSFLEQKNGNNGAASSMSDLMQALDEGEDGNG